jgi:hypothetical protein
MWLEFDHATAHVQASRAPLKSSQCLTIEPTRTTAAAAAAAAAAAPAAAASLGHRKPREFLNAVGDDGVTHDAKRSAEHRDSKVICGVAHQCLCVA